MKKKSFNSSLSTAGVVLLAVLLASCSTPRSILDVGSRAERDRQLRWAEIQYNKAMIAADEVLLTNPEDAEALEVKGIASRKLSEIYSERGDSKEAYEALEVSAAAGLGASQSRLALLHSNGVYTPRNISAILPGYARLANEDKSIRASILLAELAEDGRLKGSGLNTDPAYWYAKASSYGSVRAKDVLAKIYAARGRLNDAKAQLAGQGREKALGKYLTFAKDSLEGRGASRKNLKTGTFWLKSAAEISPERASTVAISFYRKSTSQTDREAVLPFMLSVPSGDVNELIADYGSASDENQKREILNQIRASADDGNGRAALFVARILRGNSNDVSPDALKYYEIAAKSGQKTAIRLLVDQASFGASGDPSTDEIVQILKDVADNGDTEVAVALARFYRLGGPTPEDLEQSFFWSKKAADGGDVDAQFNTGVAYAEGRGVTPNPEAARRYLSAASESGNSAARAYLEALPSQ